MSVAPERIIVAIPTLNEAESIAACLASLMDGDPALARVRFVVADGGSADDTCAIVSRLAQTRPNLTLIRNSKRIQAAAVNLVARSAGGADVLVRCDAHALYPPGYVLGVANALAAEGADSIVSPMDSVGVSAMQRAIAWASDSPFGNGGAAHRAGRRSGPVDHGHHAGFRLARFLSLGGYDERFAHNEDAEYDLRLLRAGGRIHLRADLRVRYRPRATLAALWRQYRNYGRGRRQTLRKHKSRPRLRQAAPAAHLGTMAFCVAFAPLAPALLLYPAAYLAALGVIGAGFAWAKRDWAGLLTAPALFVMHVAWALGFLGGEGTPARSRAERQGSDAARPQGP